MNIKYDKYEILSIKYIKYKYHNQVLNSYTELPDWFYNLMILTQYCCNSNNVEFLQYGLISDSQDLNAYLL